MSNKKRPSLPRPRLVIRIGVTGHRTLPGETEEELRSEVRRNLESVQGIAARVLEMPDSGYCDDPVALRIISPLAEGADRLVAREALALGFELHSPLPFPREEYRKDFESADSQREYDGLLKAARGSVFELDVDRERASLCYEAVGRIVLEQCDVLVAIWDGEGAGGQGGTARIVEEAVDQEIPIIWIRPAAPSEAYLLLHGYGPHRSIVQPGDMPKALEETLIQLLRPPTAGCEPGVQPETDIHGDYAMDVHAGGSPLGFIWQAFVTLMSLSKHSGRAEPVSGGSERRAESNGRAGEDTARQPRPFHETYCHADQAAAYYSGLYRASILINYGLGVVAVFCALLSYAHHSWETFWVFVELLAIGGIFLITFLSKRRSWHQRAIDCRFWAEQFRQMQFMFPIARVTPSTRPPAHYAFGDPRGTWMNWHFRATVRDEGMPAARLTPEYLADYWRMVRHEWIGSQVDYHVVNKFHLETINHRLHVLARIFFVATALACGVHLVVHNELLGPWLTLLAAGLPACGAAAHAVCSHGEFKRLVDRSEAMAAQLGFITGRLDNLRAENGRCSSLDLVPIVTSAAQTMMDEVSDWRVLYRKPPIEPA